MLIKGADDQTLHLAELEQLVNAGGHKAKLATKELQRRQAGIRGEKNAAYLIDFEFKNSKDWAVIHDIRLEHDGRVAQIDHLLINRVLEVYVLETKSFHSGLKITEDGEFLRWNAFLKRFEGMASPLEQNSRHIQVLKEVMSSMALPERLGIRISPTFHSYVLVEPSARIDRPKRFDASRVIKADQLKRTIDKKIEGESALLSLVKATKLVGSNTVKSVACQLVALHSPLRPAPAVSGPLAATPSPVPTSTLAPSQRIEPTLVMPYSTLPQNTSVPLKVRETPPTATASSADAPACKHCQDDKGNILYGKYGYYLKCGSCEKNTAIRLSCIEGHSPKLRKQRESFYRECAECGTSALFFRNITGTQAT